MNNNRSKIYLVGIFILAFILRVIFIESRSIQYDDAFSMLLSEKGFDEIIKGTSADTMPPLYYFLLHIWQLFSSSIGWQRFLSVILNLLAILFLYLSIKEMIGEVPALIAAGIQAVSPLMIYHAQDIRMYSLLAAGIAGYVFFFQRWERADFGWKNHSAILGVLLTGTISLYTHNLAIFSILALNVYLLVKRNWKGQSRLMLMQLLIAIGFLPWMLEVPGQLEKIQNAFWTLKPGWVEIIQAIILTTGNLPLPNVKIGVILVCSLFLFIVVVISLYQRRKDPGVLLFTTLAVFPPSALFILSYAIRPVFVPRGFIFSYMAYSAIVGCAIASIKPRFMAAVLMSMILASSILSLPGQYSYASFPRAPFRSMVSYLASIADDKNLILHDNKLSFFPAYVYDRTTPQKFLADAPGSSNDTLAIATQEALALFPETDLSRAIDGYERVYFVVFSTTISDYLELGQAGHPALIKLDDMMREADRYQWNDLEVHVYERR